MQVTIEKGEIVIRLAMNPTPVASKSGKTSVVASSHGNRPTSAIIEGKPVVVGVNCYIGR